MKSQITLSHELDRDGVIRALIPVVRRHVQKLSRGPHARVRDDELLSAGMMGLLEASKRFDPTRADSFVGYATLRIRGAMIDELRKADDLSQDLRTLSKKLQTAMTNASQKLGRAASEEEIAGELGVALPAYLAMLDSVATVKAIAVDPEEPMLRDARDAASDPAERAERSELRAALIEAIDLLPLKEQQVMAMHYDHDLSFREIGEVMNLTAARVCQLHAQAVHRIRQRLGERDAEDRHG
ncbi:MAG: FliA/WhiG family RNA polymerase sigma factor [Deltaproteobacteria bacterium]|nr:FliA/WhiG family RNA polymerase sigma factor [Deltaproteobacteria bacterium]